MVPRGAGRGALQTGEVSRGRGSARGAATTRGGGGAAGSRRRCCRRLENQTPVSYPRAKHSGYRAARSVGATLRRLGDRAGRDAESGRGHLQATPLDSRMRAQAQSPPPLFRPTAGPGSRQAVGRGNGPPPGGPAPTQAWRLRGWRQEVSDGNAR